MSTSPPRDGAYSRFRGTWYVVPTPFGGDGSLDLESLRELVDAAIGWGVDGLTVMGVTSETPALSRFERVSALEAIAESVRGRVPVVVGCSAATADGVAELMRHAKDLRFEGSMVAAPHGVRDVDLLPDFYADVAKRGELALVLQDDPASTGVSIPVGVLLRSLEGSGARTVKLEDPPTPPKIAGLLAAAPHLDVFGGLGGVYALSELRRGACGTMTGFAFPEILTAVRRAMESGDRGLAGRLFDRYLPLLQFEAQPVLGLAIRKELLRRRGVIRSPVTRGATDRIDAVTAQDLDDLLDRLGIVPAPQRLAVS